MPAPSGGVREVAAVFVRLGLTAFGGPAAHLSMMQEEVVRRRRWLPREEFLDLVGAANVIPGPSSTELALHLGYRRAGWPGLLAAGAAFILPASLVTLLFAWAYVAFGALPSFLRVFAGVKPVVLAIILNGLFVLGRIVARSRGLVALGGLVALLALLRHHEVALLFGAGLLVAAIRLARKPGGSHAALLPLLGGTGAAAPATAAAVSLSGLFFVFLKVGALLFGSGYVLLAFLQADLVQRRGWMTDGQLLDAIAVGQFTPGPVFTTATFIGYVLGRVPGAAAATFGIFLPAFIYVALTAPALPRLRTVPALGGFLDGANAAALGLMAAVAVTLSRSAITGVPTALLTVASLVVLVLTRLNPAWLVLLGGAAGALFAL
ncbi:MAG TPA: chromate efflux transporter [Thermoanaerobaculia bacterium]|nr:chromate efflux transporter [Thermoanaerobaculia bacterium]